ncbi:MAG: LPS export ABC transporter periplasmic protein LptC [Paludibacteraceae bacterium]|nr:LPS export ABC transporter periplasmic protein LptC [Paludibacteraceae bacterium]
MVGRRLINKKGLALLSVGAMLFFVASCAKKERMQTTSAVEDRSAIPVLDEYDISTVISDSGITRYRISAPHLQIFDMAQEPYWEFGDGITLEQFAEDLHVEASVIADYAKYHQSKNLWELDGNVEAVNLQGEVFETQQLFWDRANEQIYSDSLIRITRATSIIIGMGFESNQTLTKYVIRNPKGTFPVKEHDEEDAEEAHALQDSLLITD